MRRLPATHRIRMPDVRKKQSKRQVAEGIVTRLRQAGHVALFAGGCVRDLVMKRPPHDFDVATDAAPDRVVGLFPRTEQVGAKFGVVIVRSGGQMVEVATFRRDQDYSDGRHPDAVSFSDPIEDARRRDFTINGMFYDPADGRVLDYVGGMEDIGRGLVRAIGDPHQRFAEDHLRMLRAARFAARLSFEIEPATADAIRALADRLRVISTERIRTELVMILTAPSRRRGWELMHQTGLSGFLVEGVRWTDDEAADVAARLGPLPHRCSERLALAVVFRQHPPREAAGFCRKLTCSNLVVAGVSWLLEKLPRVLECASFEPADFKMLLADPRCPDLISLMEAEITGRGLPDEPLRVWRRESAAIPPQEVAPPRLLTGDELVAMGYAPGPAFSRVLAEVYRRQLNGMLADRSEAIAAAKELMENPAHQSPR